MLPASGLSPAEQAEEAYRHLEESVAGDLLERLKQESPGAFEQLVIRLLVAMGYGGSFEDVAEMVVGRPGDEGIDGTIKQDPLGLDIIYVQAKRWNTTVGEPQLQEFVGSMTGRKGRKGVFVTTSQFSEQARRYAEKVGNLVLIDGKRLVHLMIQHGIGVTEVARYVIHKIDENFFEEI